MLIFVVSAICSSEMPRSCRSRGRFRGEVAQIMRPALVVPVAAPNSPKIGGLYRAQQENGTVVVHGGTVSRHFVADARHGVVHVQTGNGGEQIGQTLLAELVP